MRPEPRAENSRAGRPRLPGDCVRARRRLLSYLDGELAAPARYTLEQHLTACLSCSRELQQLEQAEQALSGVRGYAPPPGDLRAGFYARLAAEPAAKRKRIDWRVAVPALAACALVAGWFSAPHSVPLDSTASSPNRSSQSANASTDRNRQVAQADVSAPPYGLSAPANAPHAWNFAETHAAPSSPLRHENTKAGVTPTRRAASRLAIGKKLALAAEVPARKLSSFQKTARRKLAVTNRARKMEKSGVTLAAGRYAAGQAFPDSSDKQALGVPTRDQEARDYRYLKDMPSNNLAKEKFGRTEQHEDERARSLAKSESLRYQADIKAKRKDDSNFGLALGTNLAVVLRSRVEHFGELAEDDGVDLQIRDTQRGFVSSTRLASQVREENGRRMLTIEADDSDAPGPVETTSPPPAVQPVTPGPPSASGSDPK